MAESNSNLWAPWRMQYIHSIGEEEGCFLCRYAQAPARDADNHVLWRSERSLTLLNRFPYTGGHLLIAPLEHEAELEALSEPVLLELTLRVRDAKRVLRRRPARPPALAHRAALGRRHELRPGRRRRARHPRVLERDLRAATRRGPGIELLT
jgi:hypothetical protein